VCLEYGLGQVVRQAKEDLLAGPRAVRSLDDVDAVRRKHWSNCDVSEPRGNEGRKVSHVEMRVAWLFSRRKMRTTNKELTQTSQRVSIEGRRTCNRDGSFLVGPGSGKHAAL
jgi:hypothetical protein